MEVQHFPRNSVQAKFVLWSLAVILTSYAISFALPAMDIMPIGGSGRVTRFGWQCFVAAFVFWFRPEADSGCRRADLCYHAFFVNPEPG